MYQQFLEEVNRVIKQEHYEHYSYASGLALGFLMRTATCSEELRDWLYEYIDDVYSEVVAVLKAHNLHDGVLATWQDLIRLEDLDAIVDSWEEWV